MKKILKARAEVYGLDKPAKELLVTDILAAERTHWESLAAQATPAEPKENVLPLVLPVQGARWEEEIVKVPTKRIQRMRNMLKATEGGYT